MSFLRIDDAFPEHPKVHPLSDKAFRLHVTGLCFCARNLTDGVISDKALKLVRASCDAKPRHVSELVHARLWHVENGGYRIHDYLDKNFSAAEISEKRAKRAEAGRLGGLRSGEARRQANAEANAEASSLKQNGKHGGSTPSHPIPKSETQRVSQDAARAPALQRLVAAAGGGPEAAQKIARSLGFPPPSEDILEDIIERATGKNVRDPLAVALSELAKRGRAA